MKKAPSGDDMIPTSSATAPVETFTVEMKVPPVNDANFATDAQTPSAEQIRALETVFAQEQEARLVCGLLGMWTGTMLLRDLALEHLSRKDEEEKQDDKDRDHSQPRL